MAPPAPPRDVGRIAQDARGTAGAADLRNPGLAFASTLLDELERAGLHSVVVCPGSRSTPLTVAAVRHPGLRCWSQIDERSGAFFALGLAKASRAPVALVCTSGTAAANFLPAVVEAHYANVPLLVLTADRPPERREWGAGQTIDQVRLYGSHVRFFCETALPTPDSGCLRYARALAGRAWSESTGVPAGPVHLNLPFREPLEPPFDPPSDAAGGGSAAATSVAAGRRGDRPYMSVRRGSAAPDDRDVTALFQLARVYSRGVIACGPLDAPDELGETVVRLARAAGWPILADPTSQLRRGPHTVDAPILANADLFLREECFAAENAPELILRIGGTPTCKPFRVWTERHLPGRFVSVDPDGGFNDPSHLASDVIRADPASLLRGVADRLEASEPARVESDWMLAFLSAERRAREAVDGILAESTELLEPRAVREVSACLPNDAILYVSNSMPVRDLDAFLPSDPRPLRVLCNRGANGIDGMTSSALGAAAADTGPVVLLTGDLAFLHDLGGLVAAKRSGLQATVVVLDNDGGGIFSFLPIAEHGESVGFEDYFRTPHGLDLAPVAASLGAAVTKVESWEHLRSAMKESLATPGLSVLVIPIDRDRSVAQHRSISRAVGIALGAPPMFGTASPT